MYSFFDKKQILSVFCQIFFKYNGKIWKIFDFGNQRIRKSISCARGKFLTKSP